MDSMELIKTAIKKVDPSKAPKLTNVTEATELRDLGLDSVATMEMVGELEEQLGMTFSDEDMVRIQTFGDLKRHIDAAGK